MLCFLYLYSHRPNIGGGLFVFYDPLGLFIVPPVSTNFEVYGYCSPNCTSAMLPESGVEILAVSLHAHLSGMKVRLQHFRNGTKLDVIVKDDNFDSTFQQWRILVKPRLLLPNDQLVICKRKLIKSSMNVLTFVHIL